MSPILSIGSKRKTIAVVDLENVLKKRKTEKIYAKKDLKKNRGASKVAKKGKTDKNIAKKENKKKLRVAAKAAVADLSAAIVNLIDIKVKIALDSFKNEMILKKRKT